MPGRWPDDWRPYVFPTGRRLDEWFADAAPRSVRLPVPSLHVDERDDGYVVTARIPRARGEELSITWEGGSLRIAGEFPCDDVDRRAGEPAEAACLCCFSREVRLDHDVDADRAEAHLEGDLLTIRLPFAAAAHEREVEPRLVKLT